MLCFVFAALVVLLDQFFKRWIVLTLEVKERMDLIPGLIGLTHVPNTGAAFSILADKRWLLAGIAFVASVVLVFILLRYTEGFWGTLGLSAVLGGAVGNLIDRVIHGHVIDMFETQFMEFAIFNVADIFITLGFTTFCIHFIVTSIKTAKKEKEDLQKIDAGQADDQDEMYEYPEELGPPDFDDFSDSDTKVIPSGLTEQRYSARRGSVPESYRVEQGSPESYRVEQGSPESYRAEQGAQAYLEQSPEQDQKEPVSWREYYEPAPGPSEEATSALDAISALDALESELGLGGDLDVDKLLQEYGFEDDLPE